MVPESSNTPKTPEPLPKEILSPSKQKFCQSCSNLKAELKKAQLKSIKLSQELHTLKSNLTSDQPFSWSDLQALLPPPAFTTRLSLPPFVYDDSFFEKSLPTLDSQTTSYSDQFEGDVYFGQVRRGT